MIIPYSSPLLSVSERDSLFSCYKLENDSCCRCDVPTDLKFGFTSFICKTCTKACGLTVKRYQLAAQYIEESLLHDPKSHEICISCFSIVNRQIDSYHTLASFAFCDKCIEMKNCKCSVCQSKNSMWQLVTKYPSVLVNEVGRNSVKEFVQRNLMSHEQDIITMMSNIHTQDKTDKILAQSKGRYVTYKDIYTVINHVFSSSPEDVILETKLSYDICDVWVNLLVDRTKNPIFFHQNDNTDVLTEDLSIFFSVPSSTFQMVFWEKTKFSSSCWKRTIITGLLQNFNSINQTVLQFRHFLRPISQFI